MKKISMFILTMLLPLVAHAAGTSTLSIEPMDIKAGETKTMFINLNNPNQQVTMVEFYLQLPEGLTVVDSEDNPDIAGRTTWKKHSLYMTLDGNKYHIMLASATNQLLSGSDGAIISIQLTASSNFKGGTITLTKQVIGSPDMVESRPVDYSYTIKGEEIEDLKDGDVFTALTAEGVEMTFKVISAKSKTCQVGIGEENSCAIDKAYKGFVTIPATVKGFLYIFSR